MRIAQNKFSIIKKQRGEKHQETKTEIIQELRDSYKRHNIHETGMPEEERKEQKKDLT